MNQKVTVCVKVFHFSVTIISLRVRSTPGRLYNEREIFFLSLKEDLKKKKKKDFKKKIFASQAMSTPSCRHTPHEWEH
jgi:hypothetical protein